MVIAIEMIELMMMSFRRGDIGQVYTQQTGNVNAEKTYMNPLISLGGAVG